MKYDVIILGSGLGGLECGYILSKNGLKVCILEQNSQLGGCLQTFKRKNRVFDTGFHFVGGLDEGQFLHRLFRYFGLLDLPWHRLDNDAFAEVVINDKSYYLASGHQHFVDTLSESFPSQRKQLKTYTDFLKQVGDNISKSLDQTSINSNLQWFEKSAYEFLEHTIDDRTLRNVLSGASLTMELCAEQLPLYTFAQINNSFIQSAWRLQGGGMQIADTLAAHIRENGGEIITKAKVNRLVEKDGFINGVEYNGSEYIEGQYIISNIHPAKTLELLKDSESLRKTYRSRISNLQNTFGMFTVHLELKARSVPYLNRNVFIHDKEDLWDCSYQPNNPKKSILINYQVPEPDEVYANNIDILSPMHWEEVAVWENTSIGRRGSDYLQFKQAKAQECINLASKQIPELKQNILNYYTSTPLTYRDYTGTPKGSAYGIRKDYQNTMQTLLPSQTPLNNLFLTGQNLNLHGILGVSMSALLTSGKIIGMDNILKNIQI